MRLGEKGYTLIELLAAITLLLIVLIPFTNIFFQGFKANVDNSMVLDTKIIATGIIEELKVGISQSAETVKLGNEEFDISDPNFVQIDNYFITIDDQDFILNCSISQFEMSDEMLTGTIISKPNNLYTIVVTLIPANTSSEFQPISLKTIVKGN